MRQKNGMADLYSIPGFAPRCPASGRTPSFEEMFSLIPIPDGMFATPGEIAAMPYGCDDLPLPQPASGATRASQIRQRLEDGDYHSPALTAQLTKRLIDSGDL